MIKDLIVRLMEEANEEAESKDRVIVVDGARIVSFRAGLNLFLLFERSHWE